MAVKGEGEEARTAATLAAKLIIEHDLLVRPTSPEFTRTIEALRQGFLNLAWQHRGDDDYLLTVPLMVEAAIEDGVLTPEDREKAIRCLGRRIRSDRSKGILQSVRGRYGGYRMAPGVMRSHGPTG